METPHQLSSQDSRFLTLLKRGLRREKAPRTLAAPVHGDGEKTYADWTDDELYARAGELGVEERYGMGREELIAAIASR